MSAGRAGLFSAGKGTLTLLRRHEVEYTLVVPLWEAAAYESVPGTKVLVPSAGVAAARNAAVAHARDRGAAWLWILDDDVEALSVSPRELFGRLARPERFASFQDVALVGLEYEHLVREDAEQVILDSYACVVVLLAVRWATEYPYRGAVAEDYDMVLRLVLAGAHALRFRGIAFRAAPRATLPGGCTPLYRDTLALERAYADFVRAWPGVAVSWVRAGRRDARVPVWGAELRGALLAMPPAARVAALAREPPGPRGVYLTDPGVAPPLRPPGGRPAAPPAVRARRPRENTSGWGSRREGRRGRHLAAAGPPAGAHRPGRR